MKLPRFSRASSFAVAVASLLAAGVGQGADQTWDGGSTVNGNWSTVNNWNGNTALPGGASSNADVATFNAPIVNTWGSFAVPILIDVAYLGGINFDTSAGSYYIDGDSLTLSNGGTIQILSSLTSTNATQNFYVPLVIDGLGGQYTFANNSANGIVAGAGTLNFTAQSTISGNSGGYTTLTLSGSNKNSNTIAGVISKGTATNFAVTKSGIGTWALAGSNTFNGQLTVEEGTLQVATVNNSGTTSTASGPLGRSTLSVILGKSGSTGTLEFTSVSTYSTSTKKFTMASGGTGDFNVTNSAANLELTGVIDGSGNLLKAGPGTLLLLGANNYSGTTTISAGILNAGVAENGGTSGPFGTKTTAGSIIFDGGTLQYSAANNNDYSSRLTAVATKDYRIDTNSQTVSFATGLITVDSNGLVKSGAGTLNLNAASTYTGLTTVQGGTLKLGINDAIKSGNAVTISNATADLTATLDLNGYALTIRGAGLTLGGYNATNTAQVIGGAGSVLTLSGTTTALTYSDTNNPLGAIISVPTVDLNGAIQTFTVGNSSSAANDLSISSVIQNGSLIKDGAGTMTLTGANTYTGTTAINSGGTLQLGDGSTTGSLHSSSAITDNGTLTFKRSDTLTQGTDFNSVISGAGNVIQAGGGTTILTGTNTYTGQTTISAGTLQLGNGSTTGSLSSSSALVNDAIFTFNRSNALAQGTDFNSVISGTGKVIQAGGGTTTLSGTNTYTGTTKVNAGVLNVTGSLASGSVVTVGGDGSSGTPTLAGNGTINGATTIAAAAGGTTVAGIHSPGDRSGTASLVGTQKFNSTLTYNTGSIFEWDLASSLQNARGIGYDAVNVTGGIISGSGAVFKVVLGGGGSFSETFWNSDRTWTDIFKTADGGTAVSIASTFASANVQWFTGSNNMTALTGGEGYFTTSDTNLNWIAVPEPSSALAGLLLGAGLLRRRRK